ncbi:MAG TPA: efflux RND transporter periplasmic adaptor subunit [Patescibacteria group bacterium]|nr:efflux RND transporter periplasmic adaptor subunit [Patescibacteria group bacterium]
MNEEIKDNNPEMVVKENWKVKMKNRLIQLKNLAKKKKIYIPTAIIILIVGGISYSSYRKSHQPPVYETVKVEQGTLRQSVEATGKIESVDALSLRFETAGTITEVKVKEGEAVKSGQLLANLRLSELNAAVMQASANLNQKLAGGTPESINQLQAALNKAKADLSAVQGSTPGVEGSKLVQDAYDSVLATLQSTQVVLSSSLTAADNILGIDNSFANDEYENVLSTKSLNALETAKNNYYSTELSKADSDAAINALDGNADQQRVMLAMDKSKDALSAMRDLLFQVKDVLDNTFPGNNLSVSELNILKTDIQTARANIAAEYAGLIDAYQSIDTARNNYYAYQALADKAEAALKDAQNPPREVDVAYYRATLAAAVASRDKAILRAPIDGVVTKINKKRGEYISVADIAIEMLSPHYEIKVDIPETDVSKLELNDAVAVTLDAFGDDTNFTGKIVSIDPASTEVQDVVYYKVRVSLDDTNQPIKPGMTANVTITTASIDNALIVPTRSVRTNSVGKYVRVLENGQEQERPIQVGLKGDDGKSEILSGINIGDEIIVTVKTSN